MASRPIRAAIESDLPRIVEIYNGAIPGRMATADTAPVTVDARRVWFRAHSEDRNPLWVIESGERAVAWLALSPFYGRPAYSATKEVSVYVDAAWCRQGLATALLDHAIDNASSIGVKTMLGFIFSHNAPSLHLFGRFGFVRWGELPNIACLDDVERSLSIFGKRL